MVLQLAWFAGLRHNLFDDTARRYLVDCGPGEISGFRPLRRRPRGTISRTESNARVACPWLRRRNELPRRSPAIRSPNCHAGDPERHRGLAQLKHRAAAFHGPRAARRTWQAERVDFRVRLGRRLSRCIAGETGRAHGIPARTLYRSI